MSLHEAEIKIRTGYTEDELKVQVAKLADSKEFSFHIISKSLDARKKNFIHWLIRVGISEGSTPEVPAKQLEIIDITYRKRNKKVVIAGSGPAGFFAAFVLQKSGFDTLILERGTEVDKRHKGVLAFEKSGEFNPVSNYPFGEGGAGTFSDGKLTSRSKHISRERNFVLQTYVSAGAPAEITYLAHPHIGSDNLRSIVKSLREEYRKAGGEIIFETQVTGISITKGKATSCIAGKNEYPCDCLIFATGHSATDTYRMLINAGLPFRTKNFAIGYRAEHRQEIINKAQWGVAEIPGVKAAEYRLSSDAAKRPVYTFCMCPGGIVVPAMAFPGTSVVNGMSFYRRNGKYANAACVAGIHPDELAGKTVSPSEALDLLEELEIRFYSLQKSYAVPYCTIKDFISGRTSKNSAIDTSYPMGIFPYDLHSLIPDKAAKAISTGLQEFCRKLKGYDTGVLLGLESKTSSPVQAIRNAGGLCEGFKNIYVAGEGSGYAGGIISSAADGIKIASGIVNS